MRMMPILTRLFVISMEASSVFGCSSNVTILLNEGCCRVLSTFISFWPKEKKATSPPATRKESTNKTITVKISTPVMAGIIARILKGNRRNVVTEKVSKRPGFKLIILSSASGPAFKRAAFHFRSHRREEVGPHPRVNHVHPSRLYCHLCAYPI